MCYPKLIGKADKIRQQLIGFLVIMQYRPAPSRNTKSLAESMLRGFDEADTLEKLSTQRELESMVEDDGVLICPLFVLH